MKRFFIVFLALFFLTTAGCSAISDYPQTSDESDSSADDTSGSISRISDTFSPTSFTVNSQSFLQKLNAEGGVYEGATVRTDGDFDGKGFLTFSEGGTLTHIVSANTSQFYRVIIAARSETGASVKLRVKEKAEGVIYVPESPKADGFEYYAVDTIYLTNGSNTLDFVVEKGTVDIDYILVENSDNVSSDCYKVGTSVVNPAAGLETVGTMKYLAEIYGDGVLTAANVSIGTNAEIDAIYSSTGRYPAIRTSELAYAVLDVDEYAEKLSEDLALAEEWGKSGGIVSYKWHWYSPNTRRSVDSGAFDTEESLAVVNLDEVALMTGEELKMMVENSFLPSSLISLINDIDRIAAVLEQLDDEEITVLFEPIPLPESGLYWWGDDAEDYQKLYRLIFNRLCRYHKLSNLIWVCSVSSEEYFPGLVYCDIIGQSVFENSDASFAGRLSALYEILGVRKPMSITSRDVLASADYLSRDNAMWLWISTESGGYIINEYGGYSAEYNTLSALNNVYNSTLYITLDELPDLTNYAVGSLS